MHAGIMVAVYGDSTDLMRIFAFGSAGVQFFFVLSGFIIYYVHHGDVGTGKVLPYLQKRVVRIYPVYILVTLALAPFWLFVPSWGEPYHKSISALVLSLLLLPQDHEPHLIVAWTLIHEMMFYLVFATLVMSRIAGRVSLAMWFSVILAANILLGWDLAFPASHVLSVNNLLFALGMFAAWVVLRMKPRLPAGGFLAGNLLFLATGAVWSWQGELSEPHRAALILFFGLASFLIVLYATQPALNERFRRYRFPLLLGDASYSIYLIHNPAMALASKLFVLTGMALPNLILFVSLIIIATGAGVVLHLCIEKPLLASIRARISAPPVGRMQAPSG